MQEKIQNFAPIKQRILQIIEIKGDTKEKILNLIGISKSNFSSVGLKSEVGGSVCSKILNIYPDLSAEWLLTGKGEMFRQNVQKDVNSTPQKLLENQRTNANIQQINQNSNDKNVTSLIRILENTIVEKDKQIEKLLDIIGKGNVQ